MLTIAEQARTIEALRPQGVYNRLLRETGGICLTSRSVANDVSIIDSVLLPAVCSPYSFTIPQRGINTNNIFHNPDGTLPPLSLLAKQAVIFDASGHPTPVGKEHIAVQARVMRLMPYTDAPLRERFMPVLKVIRLFEDGENDGIEIWQPAVDSNEQSATRVRYFTPALPDHLWQDLSLIATTYDLRN